MEPANPRLLIVYNADGGIWNALAHAVHKAVSPATYPCSLCALTYGRVSMHGDWRRFLGRLPVNAVFHHRDDFARDWPGVEAELPAILIDQGAGPDLLVSAAELNAMQHRRELIALLAPRLIARGVLTG